jgi:hypothetical protein
MFTHTGAPQEFPLTFWQQIWGRAELKPRWEDISTHFSRFVRSRAHTGTDKFVYTNTRLGWFFSAYEESASLRILRGFGQFLEGSLFDWQIGDLFVSCTAGDVRVRFLAPQASETISVVGEVKRSGSTVGTHRASNGFEVGLLHYGVETADQMFTFESQEAHTECLSARALMFFCGLGISLVLQFFEMIKPKSGFWNNVLEAEGFALIATSIIWACTHGLNDWSGGDTDLWTASTGVLGVVLVLTTNNFHRQGGAETLSDVWTSHDGKQTTPMLYICAFSLVVVMAAHFLKLVSTEFAILLFTFQFGYLSLRADHPTSYLKFHAA